MIRTGKTGTPTQLPATDAAPAEAQHHYLFQSPFQHAPPGRLFALRPETFAHYERPGLEQRSPLDVQLRGLTSEATKGRDPTKLLDSVRSHPARNGPIGEKIPSVASMWPDGGRTGRVRAQARVEPVLADFMVQRTDGTGRMSLLDKIDDPKLPLTRTQRNRIKQTLGEYWTSLQDLRPFDAKASDENWNHIAHESAQVIDGAIAKGMNGVQLEDALLASLFSDSVKFGDTLLAHNIHGAIAADLVLSRRGDADMPPERIAGIVQATKEHQVGVPGLFGKLAPMMIGFKRGSFPGMDRSEKFSPEEVAALDSIQAKISQPLSPDHTHVDPETGARSIVFDDVERSLLALIDVHEWPVPDPNTPWFDASMTVIYADSAQYGMADGVGKIQLMSGPGTMFQDDTVLHSAFSCGISYIDCASLVSDELRPMYEAAAERTNGALRAVTEAVDHELAKGGVVFEPAALERIAKSYDVDLGQLTVSKLDDGNVRVHLPGDDDRAVPFFHVPLDYKSEKDCNYAKLIRSRVADSMRSAAEWYA